MKMRSRFSWEWGLYYRLHPIFRVDAAMACPPGSLPTASDAVNCRNACRWEAHFERWIVSGNAVS